MDSPEPTSRIVPRPYTPLMKQVVLTRSSVLAREARKMTDLALDQIQRLSGAGHGNRRRGTQDQAPRLNHRRKRTVRLAAIDPPFELSARTR